MKRFVKTILCLAVVAGSLVACSKESTDSRRRSDDEDPENPNPPAAKGVKLDNIDVEYYGEYYADGCHNYSIRLYSGTYDSEGVYFVGTGTEVVLDVNLSTANALKSGTFNCSAAEGDNDVFLEGYSAEDSVYPSYVYIQNDATGEDYDLDYIVSGSLKMDVKGSNVTLELECKCSQGDEYCYTYSGPFSIVDCSDEGGDDPSGDYEEISVQDYLALPSTDNNYYYMSGVIDDTYNKTYGNFHLIDDHGDDIKIYGLLDTDGTAKTAYNKYGLADGMGICLLVSRSMWDAGHTNIVDAIYVDSWEEGGEELPDGPEGDYEMKGICEGYAYNLGAAFDGISGYDDWILYLYSQNDDEYMNIEFLSAPNSADVMPSGTYTVSAFESASDVKPGVCVAVDFDENDEYAYGTYYGYGDWMWYCADSGTLTISRSGDNYTISFNFMDEYEGHSFKGSYTGPISCEDYSESSAAATKASVKSARCARTAVPGRISKFARK